MQMNRCERCNEPHHRQQDSTLEDEVLQQKLAKASRPRGETTEYAEYAEDPDLAIAVCTHEAIEHKIRAWTKPML